MPAAENPVKGDGLRLLLDADNSTRAGYIASAFRRIGRVELADEIVRAMKRSGYDVREIDSPKTHRSCRPIQLARAELTKLKQFQALSPQAKEDGWVFLNTRGTGPFRADNLLENVLRPAAEKLGITRIARHLPRHRHSTVLHDEGVPIKVARERLGHSRAETTMKHYLHLSQQADEDAVHAASRRLRRDVLAVSGS
jgi:integrase